MQVGPYNDLEIISVARSSNAIVWRPADPNTSKLIIMPLNCDERLPMPCKITTSKILGIE
jgi:hypothetical protein